MFFTLAFLLFDLFFNLGFPLDFTLGSLGSLGSLGLGSLDSLGFLGSLDSLGSLVSLGSLGSLDLPFGRVESLAPDFAFAALLLGTLVRFFALAFAAAFAFPFRGSTVSSSIASIVSLSSASCYSQTVWGKLFFECQYTFPPGTT